jgi:hypothetical protein
MPDTLMNLGCLTDLLLYGKNKLPRLLVLSDDPEAFWEVDEPGNTVIYTDGVSLSISG